MTLSRFAPASLARLLLALLLVLGPAPAPAAEPFEIDAIVSQTGNLAFIGKIQRGSLEALEEVMNQRGGIGGRPFKFVFADDQSNPQIALQLLNGFLAKNPPVVLGSTSSGSCNAMFPLVAKAGPVLYCMSSAVAPAPGGWGFAANTSNFDQIAAGIRYLRLRGWTRIAVISSTDATGQIYDTNLDASLALPENKALTIVDREHLNPTDVSASAQLSRIKAANAQVLVVGATGNAAATVFHSITDIGIELPVATGAGNALVSALKQFASFLPKELYFFTPISAAPNDVTDRGTRDAMKMLLTAIASRGLEPDGVIASSWDPGLIVVSTLRALGPNATATQVRDHLANLVGFYGVNGRYDFKKQPQRGADQNAIVVALWDPVKARFTSVSKPGGVPLGVR